MKVHWLGSVGGAGNPDRLGELSREALRRHTEVTSCGPNTDRDGTHAFTDILPLLSRSVGLRHPRSPWREVNGADATVVDLRGDAVESGWAWDLCTVQPGVVLLTDARCLRFFGERLLAMPGGRRHFSDFMYRWYGRAGREAVEREDPPDFDVLEQRFSGIEIVAEHALAVVVHHGIDLGDLAGVISVPIVTAPLPYRAVANLRLEPRRSSRSVIVLVRETVERWLPPVLEAVGQLPEADRLRFTVVCDPGDASWVRQQLAAGFLFGRVRTVLRQPGATIDDVLADAGLVINLEATPQFDAAWTQLGIMARGLPTLVPDVGWFRSLPAGAVGLVRPDDPAQLRCDLLRHLSALLRSQDLERAWGVEARRVATEEHDPARFAESLMQVLGRASELRRRKALRHMMRRVGNAGGSWLGEERRSRVRGMADQLLGVR